MEEKEKPVGALKEMLEWRKYVSEAPTNIERLARLN